MLMTMMMQVLPELLRRSMEEKGGSVLGIVLGFLFSAGIFGFSLYGMIQDHRLCTQPVQATCVDLERRRGRKGRTMYAPVWEYEYQGRYIRVTSSFSSNTGVPQVGSIHTLYVNPDDPERFRPKVSNWLLFVIVSGIFVLIIGAAAVA